MNEKQATLTAPESAADHAAHVEGVAADIRRVLAEPAQPTAQQTLRAVELARAELTDILTMLGAAGINGFIAKQVGALNMRDLALILGHANPSDKATVAQSAGSTLVAEAAAALVRRPFYRKAEIDNLADRLRRYRDQHHHLPAPGSDVAAIIRLLPQTDQMHALEEMSTSLGHEYERIATEVRTLVEGLVATPARQD